MCEVDDPIAELFLLTGSQGRLSDNLGDNICFPVCQSGEEQPSSGIAKLLPPAVSLVAGGSRAGVKPCSSQPQVKAGLPIELEGSLQPHPLARCPKN